MENTGNKSAKFFFYFLIFTFVVKLIDAIPPFQHVDALALYLTFPKLVVESGWNKMIEDLNYYYALTGYFHHLFLLPAMVFERGMALQASGQLMHYLMGLGMGAFILFKNIRGLVLKSLAALALLTISGDADFFVYAKSDGVVATLALTVAIMLYKYRDQFDSKKSAIFGLLMGLMIGVKLSALYTCFPFCVFFAYEQIKAKRWKNIFITAGVCALVFAPQLIRNYWLTGSALHPGLLDKFPGNAPKDLRDFYVSCYKLVHASTADYLKHFKFLFSAKALLWISPLCVFLNFKNNRKEINWIALYGVAPFLMFMIFSNGIPYVRFIFPVYFILIYFIFKTLENLEIKTQYLWILFVIILIDSKIDKVISRSWRFYSKVTTYNARELVRFRAPYSQVWDYALPIEGQETTRVISDYLVESFYAPKGVRLHNYPHDKHAMFLKECSDISRLSIFTYAFLSGEVNSACTDYIKANWELIHTMGRHKVYRSDRAVSNTILSE